MYAVIKTGGKQYRVAENDVIRVEKLTAEPGESIALDQVLLVGDDKGVTAGAPLVEKASVIATVLEQIKDDKVLVFKKKRRQNYRRKNGHRQQLTVLRVNQIVTDGKAAKPAAKAKAKPKAETEPKPAAPEAAETKDAAPKPAKTKAPAPKKAAETKATDAAAEGVQPPALSAPEGKADDLKKIGGVGPKLEEKLNGLGIFHYHQIAAFTPEQVAWVDQHLNFKGRIERDDWIGQAKALAKAAKES